MDSTPQIADELEDIFATGNTLARFDTIDTLISQYNDTHSRINQIAKFVSGEMSGAMHYFLTGNRGDSRDSLPGVDRLFEVPGAVAALNSAYWSKAMQLTDVLDMMPQARRDAWNESITNRKCPPFEEKVVRDTLETLLGLRAKFLAERVDGIFRGLSGEHVTNQPQGFSKRMIIAGVLNFYASSDHSKCGLINDLRAVIAKFMKRGEPKYHASSALIVTLKGRWGEWVMIDGGALKIRLYKKGTAHMEVHPDIAWRLNSILANLYPRAIPPQFRERPKSRPKDVVLIQRPLPFPVVELLAQLEQAYDWLDREEDWQGRKKRIEVPNTVKFHYSSEETDKHVMAETRRVLESLGGTLTKHGWAFDYPPRAIIDEVVASGCIPDDRAHQFYQSPDIVAEAAIELACIGPDDLCLEPSAGLGSLAGRMPKDRTTCVEISSLRAEVLKAKGLTVECADFLAWADKYRGRLFDRIVMNPPFDRGQWKAHLEAAAALVIPGGRLVSVLPSGAKDRVSLPGFECSFPKNYSGAFSGTSVDVVVLVSVRSK